jgi:predicted metal-dependent peptidase
MSVKSKEREIVALAKRLSGAMFAMHRRLPFFAMLLESCSIHLNRDGRVPTACVDARNRITFGQVFSEALTDLQLMFVLAHEVSHVAFGHFRRCGTREHVLWNVACDYAINQLLDECFRIPEALPAGVLRSEDYDGLSAEQIYERIVRAIRQPETAEAPPGSGGDMDYEAGAADEEVREARLPMPSSERGAADAEEWNRRIAAAASMAKKQGGFPASLERFVEEHLRSKVDWAAQLRQFLRFGVSRDGREQYTFVPCNRRHVHAGLYLPSLVGFEAPKIAFAIDTSGSMGEAEIGQAHAEIDAIRRQFGCPVYVVDCDAAVHSGRWVSPYQSLPLPIGGGGTDFRPVFAHLDEARVAVDVVVYLTDGMGTFGDDPGTPTIWVMTTDVRPPWGDFVQVGVDR